MTGENEKQGYLGNLMEKSDTELEELLWRQQKLLTNQKFLHHLPDKGAKIKNMIARVQHVLQERSTVNSATDLFQKMALNADRSRDSPAGIDENVLRQLAEQRMQEKSFTVSEGVDDNFVNVYEKVITREQTKQHVKQRFIPNRNVKHTDPHEMAENLKHGTSASKAEPIPEEGTSNTRSPQKPETDSVGVDSTECKATMATENSENESKSTKMTEEKSANSVTSPSIKKGYQSRRVYGYDDSLTTGPNWTSVHKKSAQTIPLNESISLLQEQTKRHQELQARQAALRLSQALRVPLRDYNPEGASSSKYRDTEQGSDGESESNDEDDYPD